MNVRRYTAPDMRDAMRQVRELQGPDAVILSSRRVDGVLEVVASLDDSQAERRGEAAGGSSLAPSVGRDSELAVMRRELADLRHLLMQQQGEQQAAQWASRHPLAAELTARLVECGFEDNLARSLVGAVHDDTSAEVAWSRLRARLSAAIATTQPSVLETGGMLALIGPTGVGKTTTIARLALRQIRRMGRDSVSLVSLDRQRLGAYRQLQAFGQMAGVPVILMEKERELIELTSRAGDGKLVLIDTAGQAARDAAQRRLFATIRERIELETWLVLAATHQASVLRQALRAFQCSGPSALVLTKLDESEQLAETLSVLLEQRLGLVFQSNGQDLVEHFHKADTLYLTRLALREEQVGVVRLSAAEDWSVSTPIQMPARMPPTQAMPAQLTPQAPPGGPRASMMLDSVVPFGKRPHAAALL